jgi:carbamate kinase
VSDRAGLVVVAIGGNAISPPRGDLAFTGERAAVARVARECAALARRGCRLLIVHGNGPHVGRLLDAGRAFGEESLDIHVAQTQGELGYLLSEALDHELGGDTVIALVTRVVVNSDDPAFLDPDKPVGPVLPAPPAAVRSAPTPDRRGWRRVVASPRPHAVVELETIRALLPDHHVVAGGGGGIPLMGLKGARLPAPAVVDKDWVASLLAIALGAKSLVFVTDVSEAYDDFASAGARPIRHMTTGEARARLQRGVFSPGSMEPKVMSAVEFVEATLRPAVIATIGELERALAGSAGTTVSRGPQTPSSDRTVR